MYSLLLMTAVAGGPDAAAFGWRSGGCNGCYGGAAVGCSGYSSCYGGGYSGCGGYRLLGVLVLQRVPRRRRVPRPGRPVALPPGVLQRLLGLLVPRFVVVLRLVVPRRRLLGRVGLVLRQRPRVRVLGVVLRQRGWQRLLGFGLRGRLHGGVACYGASVGSTGIDPIPAAPVMTAPATPAAPATGGTSSQGPARLTVELPTTAKLFVDGAEVAGTGATRQFHTPELPAGGSFFYDLRAEVEVNGTVQTEEKRVVVRAGETVAASFAKLAAVAGEAGGRREVSRRTQTKRAGRLRGGSPGPSLTFTVTTYFSSRTQISGRRPSCCPWPSPSFGSPRPSSLPRG